MTASVAFHLHCYQPPREDPMLGLVEPELSAFPYHDWNARITAECYRPNTSARVLGPDGRLATVRDNFAATSWNVVPTLHDWLARHAPDVERVLRADARADDGGATDAALASPAIHAILPLAHPDDRAVLVAWGIELHRARFGVDPRGMWLPETAVDEATLVTLVDHGIEFTLLMPGQAARVRPPGGAWHDVSGERIDPTRPYLVRLPDGRSITVVFGHGPLSRGVSFDGLLQDGAALADAVRSARIDDDEPRLVAVVTDGETFGHHHRYGEMALAWAIGALRADGIEVTNIGAWLAQHPATWEVELVSPSAWSCAHGVERWRSDCGCTTGGEADWNQAWRAPLRAALDAMRTTLVDAASTAVRRYGLDPHQLRVDYGRVLSGRETTSAFVAQRLGRVGTHDEVVELLELLELQRLVLDAFTSCAWFFSDLAGLEPVLALRSADAAMTIAERRLGIDARPAFVAELAHARPNRADVADGGVLWSRLVEPRRIDEHDVARAYGFDVAAGAPHGVVPAAAANRGQWLIVPTESTVVDGHVRARVVVEHRRTTRRVEVDVEVDPLGPIDLMGRVRIADGPWREATLAAADSDVVARVAVARLAGALDAEPAVALRELALSLRTRAAEPIDVAAVRAVAPTLGGGDAADSTVLPAVLVALRDSTPAARASMLTPLAPLAAAVGLAWPAPSTHGRTPDDL